MWQFVCLRQSCDELVTSPRVSWDGLQPPRPPSAGVEDGWTDVSAGDRFGQTWPQIKNEVYSYLDMDFWITSLPSGCGFISHPPKNARTKRALLWESCSKAANTHQPAHATHVCVSCDWAFWGFYFEVSCTRFTVTQRRHMV